MKIMSLFRSIAKSPKKDLLAGLSVSFILIPQSMAYAQLAGLPVEVGLYTACIPVIIAAIFGSTPQMSTGPVTIISLMTATALAPIAVNGIEGYVAYASMLAFFIGLFYLLLGHLRLGIIVDFLSHPVIVGFTNAAAILTITSQLGKIFGVSYEKGGNYFFTLYNLGESIIINSHIPTLFCGIVSILFLVFFGKVFPKLPKVLFLLILSITFSYLFKYNELFGGAIISNIPASVPMLSINFLSQSFQTLGAYDIMRLGIFGVIIGLIGFTESISVAKFVSYSTKRRLKPNKELVGQGLANIASSFTGGYGVAGSFSKTAVNLKAGAESPLSGIVAGMMVLATLLFFTPMLEYMPIATLAAIIIVAVIHMIKINPLIHAWKIQKQDAIVGVITFFVTIFATPNIEVGVIVGVFLSIALFVYKSMRPKVAEVAMYEDDTYRDIDLFGLKVSKDVGVYRFDGNLYFANSGHFESSILNKISEKNDMSYIILDFEWINSIDASAEFMLRNLVESLQAQKIKVILTGIRSRVYEKLTLSNFIKQFGDKHIMLSIDEAVKYIEKKDPELDLKALKIYKKDKNKDPELDKKVIKKISKISE